MSSNSCNSSFVSLQFQRRTRPRIIRWRGDRPWRTTGWLILITSCFKHGGPACRPIALATSRPRTCRNPRRRRSRWTLASINLTWSASVAIVVRYSPVLVIAARNTADGDTRGRCWTARRKRRRRHGGTGNTTIPKTRVLRACPLWSTRVTLIPVSTLFNKSIK